MKAVGSVACDAAPASEVVGLEVPCIPVKAVGSVDFDAAPALEVVDLEVPWPAQPMEAGAGPVASVVVVWEALKLESGSYRPCRDLLGVPSVAAVSLEPATAHGLFLVPLKLREVVDSATRRAAAKACHHCLRKIPYSLQWV